MQSRRHILVMLVTAAAFLAAAAPAAARLRPGMIPSPGPGLGIAHLHVAASSGGASPYATVPLAGNGGALPTGPTRPTGGAVPGSVIPSTRTHAPKPPRAPHVAQPAPGPGASDVPRAYLRLYRSTARRLGVDWRVLAAIGKIESDHGRSHAAGVHSGLNFAHCCSGPMQICTVASCGKVWQHYAVDADGDGTASVYDPPDAIAAAATIVREIQGVFGHNHPGLILAAYNAGPAAVQRYRGVPDYPETRAYVAQGLRYMKTLRR